MRSRFLLFSLAALSCLSHLLLSQDLRAIALSGQKAAGSEGRFDRFGQISINSAGEIAFNSLLVPSETAGGVYRWRRGSLEPIVLAGAPLPGSSEVVSGSSHPIATALGEILVRLYSEGDAPSSGLYLVGEEGMRPLVRSGDRVPSSKMMITSIISHTTNDLGQIVFGAAFASELHGNARGLFRLDRGKIVPIALPGMRTVDGLAVETATHPALDNFGNVTFLSSNPSQVGVQALSSRAFRKTLDNELSCLLGCGGNADPELLDVSAAFSAEQELRVSPLGRVALALRTDDDSPNSRLLLLDENRLEPIPTHSMRWRSGLRAIREPDINELDHVAFCAQLAGSGADRQGVFLHRDGRTEIVAMSGEPAPGAYGAARFESFSQPRLNGKGQLIFKAAMADGSQGVFLHQ